MTDAFEDDDEDPPITLNVTPSPLWAIVTLNGKIFEGTTDPHASTVLSGTEYCRCGWASYHYGMASDALVEWRLHMADVAAKAEAADGAA